ncbi:MAG: hypothetical protein IH999_04570 [Proteobacteria bacterium]|nr:hypothetical protein [Pseudomonadota bacterium]
MGSGSTIGSGSAIGSGSTIGDDARPDSVRPEASHPPRCREGRRGLRQGQAGRPKPPPADESEDRNKTRVRCDRIPSADKAPRRPRRARGGPPGDRRRRP